MPIPRVGFRGLYLAIFCGWVALTMLSLLIVVAHSKSVFDQEFDRQSRASFNELRHKLRANEIAINSFATFLSLVDSGSRDAIAQFAATMKTNYSHIYMFEVVRKLARNEKLAFESVMQSTFDPDFRIKNFGYDNNREWVNVRDKPFYYPLIFIWPELESAKSIIGLDIDSVPHLQHAAVAADVARETVSSRPFNLIEGGLAYAMFRPVKERIQIQSADRMQVFSGPLMALLVIRADDLLPTQRQANSTYHVEINGSARNTPLLLNLENGAREVVGADHWLPKASLNFEDKSPIQPLKLTIERQMLWSDIKATALIGVGLISAITLIAIFLYLRFHYRNLMHSHFQASQTEFLALHDALTSLPNRVLFDDRLKFLLSNWRRRYESFGLVFIDLDLFKEINDKMGHKVGDLVLVEVAQRIKNSVRETDTVARIGGDEFVVLLGQVNSREHLLTMAQQMLAKITEVMLIENEKINISASIGVSVCPEDGVDAETLTHRADMFMYVVKQSGRNGVMGIKPSVYADEHRLHLVK